MPHRKLPDMLGLNSSLIKKSFYFYFYFPPTSTFLFCTYWYCNIESFSGLLTRYSMFAFQILRALEPRKQGRRQQEKNNGSTTIHTHRFDAESSRDRGWLLEDWDSIFRTGA